MEKPTELLLDYPNIELMVMVQILRAADIHLVKSKWCEEFHENIRALEDQTGGPTRPASFHFQKGH